MGGVSLKPSEQTVGGLALDDVDVLFKSNRFVLYDYDGKSDVEAPCIMHELIIVETGEEHTQYSSCGSAKDFVPSKNGRKLESVTGAVALRKSCNAAMLLTSIINAGFSEEQLGDEISNLDGMVAHVIQVAAPKRGDGIPSTRKGKDGKDYARTNMSVSKIVTLPGEKKGKGKGKKDATADADVVAAAQAAVLNALIAADKPLAKHDLPALIFKSVKDPAERKAIVKLLPDDEFLASSDDWTYEGGILALAE